MTAEGPIDAAKTAKIREEHNPNSVDYIPEEYLHFKKILKNKSKLTKLIKDSTLPKRLPDSLVYWNRCECRVEANAGTEAVSNKIVREFYKTELT